MEFLEVQVDPLDIESDFKSDRHLKRYTDPHLEVFGGNEFHSFTCDKSRVGSQGLQNGFTCNPCNHGAWAPPQVSLGKCRF